MNAVYLNSVVVDVRWLHSIPATKSLSGKDLCANSRQSMY